MLLWMGLPALAGGAEVDGPRALAFDVALGPRVGKHRRAPRALDLDIAKVDQSRLVAARARRLDVANVQQIVQPQGKDGQGDQEHQPGDGHVQRVAFYLPVGVHKVQRLQGRGKRIGGDMRVSAETRDSQEPGQNGAPGHYAI